MRDAFLGSYASLIPGLQRFSVEANNLTPLFFVISQKNTFSIISRNSKRCFIEVRLYGERVAVAVRGPLEKEDLARKDFS